MVFIILMLAMDLGVFHKKDHVIKIKEAAIWTGIWVTLAMLFGLLLRFKAEWVHGITCMDDLLQYIEGGTLASHISAGMDYAAALEVYRKEIFSQYLAGYFLEETLSIDNIFVMIMIFVSFGIDKQYYHRILFWGILGAIVMRFLFIFLLGAVIHKFSWVLAIFGVILIYSGIKMFRDKGDKHDYFSPRVKPVDKAVAGKILAEGDVSYHILPSFLRRAERIETASSTVSTPSGTLIPPSLRLCMIFVI